MNNLVNVIEELQSPLNDIRSKAEKVKSIIKFMNIIIHIYIYI